MTPRGTYLRLVPLFRGNTWQYSYIPHPVAFDQRVRGVSHLLAFLHIRCIQRQSGRRGHFNLQKQLRGTPHGGRDSGDMDQGVRPPRPAWA